MKKLYWAVYAAVLLCVIGTAVFLIVAPDRVPMHYNFAGEADRVGSKYENLLYPLFAAGLGAFFLVLAKFQGKKGETGNEKILVLAGVCVVGFFTLLGFRFMWRALRYDPESARNVSYGDINRFVSIGLGVLLAVLGNVMPKAKRNSLFGLRTKWSMANDDVWQKSQRFAGIASVLAGLTLIVLSPFVPGMWNILMMSAVVLVLSAVCAAASRRYCLEDRAARENGAKDR